MKNQHFKYERSFVIIKPDGVQRSLIGEIIGRYERLGLKLIALKMTIPTREMVASHYTIDPEWTRKAGEKSIKNYESKGQVPPEKDPVKVGEKVLGRLVKYLASGPVVMMVLEGAHVIPIVRKLTGGTEPLSSDVGTIRGDYVMDSYMMSDGDDRSIRNLVHASGSLEEAEQEINLWFKPEEILQYIHIQEAILYDADLDHILGE